MDIPQKENKKIKMDNQLPESNILQNDSGKTENIFQSVKKSRISNWASWTILGVAVLAAGGAVWYYSFKSQSALWPGLRGIKENQDISTSNLCGPEPPATCGAGMRLTCVNGDWSCRKIEEKQKIIGKIIFSDIEGGCWSFQGDNGEHFLIGGDKSEEIKKIPDILSKKVEIQGKIEKDIDHFCPVREGLFSLRSYRIIEDSGLDSYKGCGTDSDCKLIYDNCDCEAVNIKNTKKYLPSRKYFCEVNNCATYNTTAVCENNQCIKKK